MSIKSVYFFSILFILHSQTYGQQAPTYSNYLDNQFLTNPAVAGSIKAVVLNTSYRKQWGGMGSGPSTQTFSVQAPIFHNSAGLGLSYVSEKNGLLKVQYLSSAYSYRLNLGRGILAMGMSLGTLQYGLDIGGLDPKDIDDSQLQTDIRVWKIDAGAGIYYLSKRLSLGLSTQHLHPFKNRPNRQETYYYQRNVTTFIASYQIPFLREFMLMPTTRVRNTFDGAVQCDVGIYVKEPHSCSVGVLYRNTGLFSFQLMLNSQLFYPKLKDQWSIGYAHDYAHDSYTVSSGYSNEIILTYKIMTRKRISKIKEESPNVSPKFF